MAMTKEKRDTIVSTLYEKCANGEISLNQRELLIQKANNLLIAESCINNESSFTESTETVIENAENEKTELSPKEKYNIFKESVYAKCIKGEITIEAREELLEKAREKFFPITE